MKTEPRSVRHESCIAARDLVVAGVEAERPSPREPVRHPASQMHSEIDVAVAAWKTARLSSGECVSCPAINGPPNGACPPYGWFTAAGTAGGRLESSRRQSTPLSPDTARDWCRRSRIRQPHRPQTQAVQDRGRVLQGKRNTCSSLSLVTVDVVTGKGAAPVPLTAWITFWTPPVGYMALRTLRFATCATFEVVLKVLSDCDMPTEIS